MIKLTMTFKDPIEAMNALMALADGAGNISSRVMVTGDNSAVTETVIKSVSEKIPVQKTAIPTAKVATQDIPPWEEPATAAAAKPEASSPMSLEELQAALKDIIKTRPDLVKERMRGHGWQKLSLIPEEERAVFLQEVRNA